MSEDSEFDSDALKDLQTPSWKTNAEQLSGATEPTGHFEQNQGEGQDFEVTEEITKVGRYEIVKRLGQGGFGFVYLAIDPQLHRKVAIKVPRWDRSLTVEAASEFLKEGKMLAQVSHPSIVGVHDVGTTEDGVPFVVMEFVEGKDLSWIIKNEKLKLDEILTILLKIAIALQHAHKKGIVHRDFKPSNVIVDDDGEIHLVDFGLALHDELSGEDWETDRVAGTPGYMAPEQIRGENHLLDGQTDIWAFGITMYRMLVGVVPFRVKGIREMMRAICYKNPKPLRQLKENTPKQLERICLRCLEKLMGDRYQSMADVIEELEAYMADHARDSRPVIRGTETPSALEKFGTDVRTSSESAGGSQSASTQAEHSSSNSRSILGSASNTVSRESGSIDVGIVPKGLRSFDQNDKEFFLKLLPGPTDRLGVPESIRFWTARLGLLDQTDEISIGVIYGPSGSGKSSFVRAGLIPKLPESVIDIYIDCTNPDLDEHISNQLCRVFPHVPEDENLSRTIRQIRNGQVLRRGDKILLVLDQFEQWLSSTPSQQQHELTEALRQCDSERVQALILIRDEFWLSTSQYLRCLGQKIVEGHNAMPLPLFDKRHARNVLKAIGRAHNTLPPEGQSLSKQQRGFINEAVDSLANRDRVICVHLSVFAETTKSSKWEVSQLRAKGGIDGIGQEYIVGIFNNPETPSFITRHSQEAWSILKQLLPDSTSELKGSTVDLNSLYRNSHVQMTHECFDELMRFLEFDCNLISRTEKVDGDIDGQPSDSRLPKYGLTHDFLVGPIREWGNAKQNETVSGRAESEFANLASQWQITKDYRFLPSLWDFCKFSLFTDSTTKSQHRNYWLSAKKRSMIKAVCLSGLLGVFCLLGVWGVGAGRARLESDFNDALVCVSTDFGDKLDELVPDLEGLTEKLAEASLHENPDTRFRANCMRLVLDPADRVAVDGIVKDLALVSSTECETLANTSNRCWDQIAPVWRREVDRLFNKAMLLESNENKSDHDNELVKSDLVACCRVAIHMAFLGDVSKLTKLMSASQNPLPRSIAIIELSKWHLSFDKLIAHLDGKASDKQNGDLISGLASGIGLGGPGGMSGSQKAELIDWLTDVYKTNDHGGIHYAIWFALNQYDASIPELIDNGDSQRRWRHVSVNLPSGVKVELPFVKISAGEYISELNLDVSRKILGIEDEYPRPGEIVKIDHGYWLCAVGINNQDFVNILEPERGSFEMVEKNLEYLLSRKEGDTWADKVARSSSLVCSLLMANRLSKFDGRTEYYTNLKSPEKMASKKEGGFRMPTESELELAWRCGSRTRYYIGDRTDLAKSLIGESESLGTKLETDFPPNANGLFGCGLHAERLDKVVEIEGLSCAIVKGGMSSPCPSGEVNALTFNFLTGSCRLALDE